MPVIPATWEADLGGELGKGLGRTLGWGFVRPWVQSPALKEKKDLKCKIFFTSLNTLGAAIVLCS